MDFTGENGTDGFLKKKTGVLGGIQWTHLKRGGEENRKPICRFKSE